MNEIKNYYIYKNKDTSLWYVVFEFENEHEERINTRCYSILNAIEFVHNLINLWNKEGLIK